ncbi:hypothetical protein CRG98_025615 [Punica granatum]|uniref:Uncharacterized protein n=1 Tax=Punica granatum TaxID=22663 RepID=A0A2I0JCN9_PUNGR|nr:hypothetical protein CRG98_025615 [Punica granatum]
MSEISIILSTPVALFQESIQTSDIYGNTRERVIIAAKERDPGMDLQTCDDGSETGGIDSMGDSSAFERAQNPDGPFHQNIHISRGYDPTESSTITRGASSFVSSVLRPLLLLSSLFSGDRDKESLVWLIRWGHHRQPDVWAGPTERTIGSTSPRDSLWATHSGSTHDSVVHVMSGS